MKPSEMIAAAKLAGIAATVYIAYRAYRALPTSEQVADAFNPASRDNLIHKGATSIMGESAIQSAGDYVFGALDLLNPWAEPARREYAKKVYGIN